MKGLHGWMRVLEDNETAVLATLLNELDRVTGSDDSSGEQLAKIILKDAHLTANIIRVANSVSFNPHNTSVTTVSRAVINIGFTHIRSLCLSIKVLESVLKERSSPLLLSTLARSLHAASQAKALCSKMKASQQEEVFVACLLSHLAELLVLGINEAEVKLLSDDLEAHSTGQDKDRAAEKYLGVSFTRLAKTLLKQWRMQGLILEVVTCTNEEESMAIKAIQLGNEISRASLLGWDSQEFKDIVNKVAEYQQLAPEQVKKSILSMADITSETIMSFGKKVLVDYIPTSKKPAKPLPTKDELISKQLLPDIEFQQQSLKQLQDMVASEALNINNIFKVVLTGLHKGVGLERLVLAIFDKSDSKFVAKYIAGLGTENWKEKFIVRFEKNQSSFLYQLFQREQIIWVGGEKFREISSYIGSEFLGVTGQKSFFIAPLQVDNKMIGFIYSDMGYSSQELNISYFEGFHKYIQQINIALNELAKNR